MEEIKKESKNIYENGKIYTIRSPRTDKFYIGSTCNPLSKRFYQHKSKCKEFQKDNTSKGTYITSYEILIYHDAYIELLELYPCKSKIELTKREGQLIRENKNNVVNKVVNGRTPKERCKETVTCECGKVINIYNKGHKNTFEHMLKVPKDFIK